MDFISELNQEYINLNEDKRGLKIGLLGSFQRGHLYKEKEHLKEKEHFNVKISSDLENGNPRNPDEDEMAYNFRLGESLIKTSQVLIIHFFNENEEETGINNSALIEIGLVYNECQYNPHLKKYVLGVYEKGFKAKNIGGMLPGLEKTKLKNWQWHEFESCEELLLHSTQFCYNCLFDTYS